MNGQKITLSDGMEIQSTTCCVYFDGLSCMLPNSITMREAFELFIDKEKTKTIIYNYGETEETYVGYTNLVMLRKNFDGRKQVLLAYEN